MAYKDGAKLKKTRTIIALTALAALAFWGYMDIDAKKAQEKEAALKQQAVERMTYMSEQGKADESVPVIGLRKGNVAPDFILKSLDGKTHKLSDYRGKKVMLNLWATWCSPCREEMPDMQSFYAEHKSDSFEILAVNLTSSEKSIDQVQVFTQKHSITFPILLDPDDHVAGRFEVFQIPSTYILNEQGVIEQKMIGPMNKEIMELLMLSDEGEAVES